MKPKLSIVVIICFIVSAGIGVSYARPTAELGRFDGGGVSHNFRIGIRAIQTLDPGPHYLQPGGSLFPSNPPFDGTVDPQWGPGNNSEGKNVASTSCENGEYLCSRWVGCEYLDFYKDISWTLDNVYPWYKTGIAFYIANCGCVPGKITEIYRVCEEGDCDQLLHFFKIHRWKIMLNGEFYASGSTGQSLKTTLKQIILYPCNYLWIGVVYHFEEEYTDCQGTHIMPQGVSIRYKYVFDWDEA